MKTKLDSFSLVFAVGCAAMFTGCGEDGPELYPVEGRVQYADGSPFPGGLIQLQRTDDSTSDGPTSPLARGGIGPDGTFQIFTPPEKNGVEAGTYRVAIHGLAPSYEPDVGERVPDDKPTIYPRFSKFESSGIQVTVEPQRNSFTIKVERP